MRKVMKGKRRKTASLDESEENGVENVDNDYSDEEAASDSSLTANSSKKSAGKSKRTSRGKPKDYADDSDKEEEYDAPAKHNSAGNKNAGGKRRKTEAKEPEPEPQYEVEKIVGKRVVKGQSQFLVRWKDYGPEEDTWEAEKDLSCPELIEEFLASQDAENGSEEPETPKAKPEGKKKGAKGKKEAAKKKDKGPETTKEKADDDNAEYEVDKIIEVRFPKNKPREFLIRWKGFTSNDDTWEPESNLNCEDLISKFMEKVEKAKSIQQRELRANPRHTKRYTLSMHIQGKRHSRRYANKQRATYHECDA